MGCSKFLIFFYNPTLICTSLQLCPWPVWRAPWSSWCRLLGGAPCLVVPLAWWWPLLSGVADSGAFQNRCIYTEIMWLLKVIGCTRSYLGASYQSGWINMHTRFSVFNVFETSYFFHFTSPIWTILCMSVTWNPNKNQFKLQVVMQQNRTNSKGVNTFAWHCIRLKLQMLVNTQIHLVKKIIFKSQM